MFLANFSCLVHEFGTFRSMFLVEFKKENTRGAKNNFNVAKEMKEMTPGEHWHFVVHCFTGWCLFQLAGS